MHKRIEFGPYEAALPMNKATNPLIFRCLWTSYDYLSQYKVQDDIVVGGVVDFQMYEYPKQCLRSHSKFKTFFIFVFIRMDDAQGTSS